MKRRLLHLLVVFSVFVLIGTICIWIGGTNWIGRCSSYVRQVGFDGASPVTDVGQTWFGFYSDGGKLGIVRVDEGTSGLEPDELESTDSQPPSARWFWNRTGDTDFIFGTIPYENADLSFQIPHSFYIWDGEDAGMRHFENVHAVLFDDWILIATALIPISVAAGILLRNRRRQRQGRCLRCGYDLRASPSQCPECGNSPQVPTL